MIYKSALILFVLLAGGLLAPDHVNDSALGSDTPKKRRPHVHGPGCGHLPPGDFAQPCGKKKLPKECLRNCGCGKKRNSPNQPTADLGEHPAAALGKTSAILGELPAADFSKTSAVDQVEATLKISKSDIVVPQKEEPSIQKIPRIERDNKDVEKSDVSDVKELEATVSERQEPAVQGSLVQDLKEKLVDENRGIARAESVEKLEISDIQPEVPDVQSGYVQDLVDHHKSAEEDGVTNVEDNEDNVSHTEESVEFPKFLKVKKSYKSAEEDKTSDREDDFEVVEDADEESDDENSQSMLNIFKKNSRTLGKKKPKLKSQKTSTRSEILKFVQISHTG